MSGRVDTEEGRRLLANHEADNGEATTRASEWLFDNADALLAAAEERETLREALKEIAHRGQVFDAKGTWSKRVCEIARAALAATDDSQLDAGGARRVRRAPGPSDPGGEREPRGDPGSAPGSANAKARLGEPA